MYVTVFIFVYIVSHSCEYICEFVCKSVCIVCLCGVCVFTICHVPSTVPGTGDAPCRVSILVALTQKTAYCQGVRRALVKNLQLLGFYCSRKNNGLPKAETVNILCHMTRGN